MADNNNDKPWNHPERSDWCKVLHFMANQIRDGKTQAQVVEDTSDYIDKNELKFSKGDIANFYSWLYREVHKESQ